MEGFYQTMAGFCFTLLGLWWAVVQFRHDEWMGNAPWRRLSYSVHLSFLVPGVMSLGAIAAGDVKLIWRLTFVLACAFGIAAMLILYRQGPAGSTLRGWFIRRGRWLIIVFYALIALVAAIPDLTGLVGAGLKPLQVEGLLLTLLVFIGASVAWDFLAEPKA